MGKMQRTKGASFERESANALKDIYPEARRGIGQARSAGEVCDVEGTPFWLELKHHRLVSIQGAFTQAVEASAGRRPPVVISKDNRSRILVTMDFEQFRKLLIFAGITKAAEKVAAEPGPCAYSGCSETAVARGLCQGHAS